MKPTERKKRFKAPTGIEGLDNVLAGGLPRGRATLLIGGPGSGKTLLALQTLVNGARTHGEPGIFVAFEEHSQQIIENASEFAWNLPALNGKQLFFLDAKPSAELAQSGEFDLVGLLANLGAKCRSMGAKRIVFDSLDVLLENLEDQAARRREVFRLHEWLLEQGLTAVITAKAFSEKSVSQNQATWGFMQFMMDCAIALNHEIVDKVSQRSLHVIKYRGSFFFENESSLIFGPEGLEVAGPRREFEARVSSERVSSGVKHLDSMLGGGYFRGASVLVTGSPGTAKTTLGGAFSVAACQRGERTLFVSFDSEPKELMRNLASVCLPLNRHAKTGLLRVVSIRNGDGSAEAHLLRIKRMAREHRARCLVIDPVSALAKQGNELTAHSVVERMVEWAKSEGVTLLCTSLIDKVKPENEATSLQISTIADTWIHLSYLIHAGERNRALTIIKSRGTHHSNQVRELILTGSGVTLADVFTAGGEVLMGTLRWEKEEQARAEERKQKEAASRTAAQLEAEAAELAGEIKKLKNALTVKQRESREALRIDRESQRKHTTTKSKIQRLRGSSMENILISRTQ